jgi:protein phosphatase
VTVGIVVGIPDPSLVVLIGAAGSGKSTFATGHFAREEVLSSDAYRAAIAGNAADQSVSGAAFKALHAALDRRLRDGRLAVVDATNLTPRARRDVIERGRAAHVPTVAIVLDLPADIVLARNAARLDRVVPEDVVRRHLDEVRRLVDGGVLQREGFTTIVTLRAPAAVSALEIRRDPPGGRS